MTSCVLLACPWYEPGARRNPVSLPVIRFIFDTGHKIKRKRPKPCGGGTDVQVVFCFHGGQRNANSFLMRRRFAIGLAPSTRELNFLRESTAKLCPYPKRTVSEPSAHTCFGATCIT